MTDKTLAASLRFRATERPDEPAIICEDRQVTYAELHRESNRVAHALRAAGLGRGARVAYLGKESEHYYEIALACAKAETVLVPVNWRLTAKEVDYILRDSETELLFVERELVKVVEALPSLKTVVHLDTDSERAAGLKEWTSPHPDTDVTPSTGPDDAIVQIYTSGTTGLPKGVVLPQRSFYTFLDGLVSEGLDWMDWQPGDRNLISLPGFQIAGFSSAMQAFIAGATNVVMRMFVSQEALEQIEKVGVTTTFAAPAMLAMILAEPGATRDSFKTMRKLVYGGSPISEPLLKQCMDMIDCDFLQIYASTETGNVAACLPPFDHVPGSPRLKAAGRAYPGVELKVVDREGKEVPTGELGEVCVYTPAHMIGYWNKAEETEKTLVDGWIHTGDAGYLDDDGYLYLGDRIKDLIIVAGQNVYPAEVEAAIAQHPAVADVAVIGVPDERWGEAIRACVVLRPGEEATPRQLTLAAREHLADFKIPSQWDFVAGLPRNPAGKILRRILRDKFWEHMERKVN